MNIKNRYIATLLGSILLFTSCEEYLDIVPDGTQELSLLFNRKETAYKALANTYSYLPQNDGTYASYVLASDEVAVPVPKEPNAIKLMKGQQNVSSPLMGYWSGFSANGRGQGSLWEGIRSANTLIQNIDLVVDMPQEEKNQWKAEVKFLKAYFHFLLVSNYGPIPIVDENLPITASDQEVRLDRKTVDECFSYIVETIDAAILDLPVSENFMIVVIFPYLPGSDSPVFQGVSVFLGFLFTFGSAGSLSNIIAGLVLTYMRLFKMGDRVKIGSISGDVIEKNMLVTRVRTTKNEIISIPNATVMNSHTINYSSDAPEKGLIMHSTITIGYDIPWRKMEEVLIKAALKTPLLLEDPAPFVLQTSLDDFYVSYQINAYTREPNKQATIYSNLHANIQDFCNEAGIEIMSPHYRAARDGNQSTIPADQLPKDYKAPSFMFKREE